jgi:hypothetical protein
MSDPTTAPFELSELIDTLRGLGTSVRNRARQERKTSGDPTSKLSRRLDRAGQCIEQALRALRGPLEDDRPADAPMVPGLTGSTGAIPLSSLVSFLADVNTSGVLRIYAPDENFVLQFENGYLIYAFGDNPPEGSRLGEVLVSQGAINKADLLRVLDAGWNPSETLGGLLVREGYVDAAQLQSALEAQIQELGSRLFSHDDARFRFYPLEQVIASQDVRINVMGLLLESARKRDEAVRGGSNWAPPLFDLDVA